MNTFEILTIILLAITAVLSVIAVILVVTGRQKTIREINSEAGRNLNDLMRHQEDENDALRENLRSDIIGSRAETVGFIDRSFKSYGDLVAKNQNSQASQQNERLAEVNNTLSKYTLESEQKLDNIRQAVTARIADLTQENNRQIEQLKNTMDKQLDQMRQTVDEKLQKTLESRIGESFRLVNERLEQVYKGLGEMQSLATGVGDLKKVLSNVKTRGILGEVQLGNILEQILAPGQYDTNVATKPGSSERVEFAVRLPGNSEDSCVYLPIDAKFPGDAYAHLMDAYDTGDADAVEAAAKELERVIKSEAKDIREKYVDPPYTTDFGIMFLPVEGLYAEVVRRGLLEQLQREYKVNIAGPTTMAALLNSLQMGFRTLAIEKHTSEVWETLGAVKTEFEKFEGVLAKAQKDLNSVGDDLSKLIGTRTRSIQRKLRDVEKLEDSRTIQMLGTGDLSYIEEEDPE